MSVQKNFIRRALSLTAACLMLGFTGCGGENGSSSGTSSKPDHSTTSTASSVPEPARVSIPGISAANYPRIDGSTANLPLLAHLYAAACGVPLEEAETLVEVSGGTGAVWRNMMAGNTDLLLVYEAPLNIQEELNASGIDLEITPIGRDGLVFLINDQNPAGDLTQDQLRDIYTGAATDWGQVGGDPGPITAYQRNPESGSQTLFLKLLMKDTAPMDPPKEWVPGMMGELIENVSSFDGEGGAIGYSVFYYAKEMYAKPNLKLISVDSVAPTAQSIGDGTYPLVNDFYVVIRADAPEDSPQRIIRDWLLTEEGSSLLRTAGYVPAANE